MKKLFQRRKPVEGRLEARIGNLLEKSWPADLEQYLAEEGNVGLAGLVSSLLFGFFRFPEVLFQVAMPLTLQLGLALIDTEEFGDKIFIGLVIHYQQEFPQCLCQHYAQQQYDRQIFQPCKIKVDCFKIIQKAANSSGWG